MNIIEQAWHRNYFKRMAFLTGAQCFKIRIYKNYMSNTNVFLFKHAKQPRLNVIINTSIHLTNTYLISW